MQAYIYFMSICPCIHLERVYIYIYVCVCVYVCVLCVFSVTAMQFMNDINIKPSDREHVHSRT